MSEYETGQVAPAVDGEAQTPAAATAPADTQVTDTQAGTTEENTTAVEKSYSKAEMQELIEKATAKAAAKAERRAHREVMQQVMQQVARPPQQQAYQPRELSPRREGESEAQYVQRMVDQSIADRDQAASQQKLTQKTEKLYAEAAKLPGFDRDDFNDLLVSHPFSAEFSHALVESDMSAQIMAYMTGNPDDAVRISALSPTRQAAEIGKLEVRLSAAKPTSKAPPPINPLSGNRGGNSSSLESANLDEYAAMRAKQGAPWARR